MGGNAHGDRQYGPCFELRPSKKHLGSLTPWRLTGDLVERIIAEVE